MPVTNFRKQIAETMIKKENDLLENNVYLPRQDLNSTDALARISDMIYRPGDDFSKGCQRDRWLNIDTFAIVSHICKFSVVSFSPGHAGPALFEFDGSRVSQFYHLALKGSSTTSFG
jgi:hypothetical protein